MEFHSVAEFQEKFPFMNWKKFIQRRFPLATESTIVNYYGSDFIVKLEKLIKKTPKR